MHTNGVRAPNEQKPLQRADEANELLTAVKGLVVDFIKQADQDALQKADSRHQQQPETDPPCNTLIESQSPIKLQKLLDFSLPEHGRGRDGLVSMAQIILKYSVNTWNQGFLDKLYASPTPVGLAADVLLASLNTNVHIYQVSPALTVIERDTCRAMASMMGLTGPWAGGVSQSGGSAANQTSMVIARNNLFPETKEEGYGGRRFVLFTSEHGHYSVEKAAQMFGFGSKAVRSVPVDEQGRMRPDALDAAVERAKENGETPFYVNATAGTTVYGSFDPLDEIADICQKHNLWMHVDGSWGASVIFSEKQKYKLKGIERADTVAICPHKMMNVALTCSLLLGKDLRQFHKAMTLPAGYLFHSNSGEEEANGTEHTNGETPVKEYWDLGDLTPQCGRRGDSLKLALSWIYYGTSGYAAYIDHAFDMASYLASLVSTKPNFSLLSENPPPCLQICFYFNKQSGRDAESRNSRITEQIKDDLLPRGFMIDYAPGEDGKFFRVVVNGQTRKETVEALVIAIEAVGAGITS
ncbi:Glutamate decarboxylase 2 [Vermiconidia calcicola]|uniref:Glutamate decarboxylase 2 n=1 Tax=Vermiconidia calcicola TaxID=1690605 RepID=A0ACC3MZ36_9PEZI|nr:Glutamate decarboxylase 2 [Vermiconidia calcicola]